jgi:hypothetical protein
MAVPHGNWSVSGIDTSGQARVHIGPHNEYHDHQHYGDESQLSPIERQKAREDAILSSLYFTDMSQRERAIDSPCDGTFGWIFNEKFEEQRFYYKDTTSGWGFDPDWEPQWKHHHHKRLACNLMSRWLKYENGMFFVVGKAGSGKSTFMRFLARHSKTRTLLESWASENDCALTVCAHYFWCSSGSRLQCSQEGLWRSILYALAQSDRKLASAMFANRICDDCHTLAQVRSQPWTRNDLTSALSLLVDQLKVLKVAVCLFIDGLDEFQGDEMLLIAELRKLLGSPYIKICASSRPRNLFEEAFGREDYQWKLALHSLTRGDMAQLARTRLYEDDAFCKLVDRNDRRQRFVATITGNSQGVFLWTVLVIGEMIREAHQADTIDELEAHLHTLTFDLSGKEGMHQRIIDRSDPRYRKYMARLLLVMLGAGYNDLFWEDVHFLYDDAKDIEFATRECLGLDDKYRLAWDREIKLAAWKMDVRRYDETSCRGLFLACHQGAHPPGINCQLNRTSFLEDTRRRIRKWCPDFIDTNDWTPHFSHRSVGEYLSVPDIRERMTDLAGRGFDPVLTRCHLRLAHSRLKSPQQLEASNPERAFIRMIACVDHERVRMILPKFKRIQDTKWSWVPFSERLAPRIEGHWAKGFFRGLTGLTVLHGDLNISRSAQAHAWFLSLVASESSSLVWWCRELWSQVPTPDRMATGTIIIAGLLPLIFGEGLSRDQTDLVQCLLCSGVNPNKKYTWFKPGYLDEPDRRFKVSLWEVYVEAFVEVWMNESGCRVSCGLDILQLMLHDGRADKQCRLPEGRNSLLNALTFEPENMIANEGWGKFAGRLHDLLDAHGLLSREERRVALEQGWLSTTPKATLSPHTALLQSAPEPDTTDQHHRRRRRRRRPRAGQAGDS